jgi:hypothetical protein
MHLVSCASPQDPLEAAPRTALLADLKEGERWEGFWSSDLYFVRCTRQGGEIEWFRVADEDIGAAHAAEPRTTPHRGSRTTGSTGSTGSSARTRVAVVVARSPNGQRMLIGSGKRTAR